MSKPGKEQRDLLVQLIEDGEVDDYLSDLQEAIDDRNGRRKDTLLRQIRGVWGEDAQIVVGSDPSATGNAPIPSRTPMPGTSQVPAADTSGIVARAQYVPQTGPQVPSGAVDRMQFDDPIPMQSSGGGDFSAVADPMAAGPGE